MIPLSVSCLTSISLALQLLGYGCDVFFHSLVDEILFTINLQERFMFLLADYYHVQQIATIYDGLDEPFCALVKLLNANMLPCAYSC